MKREKGETKKRQGRANHKKRKAETVQNSIPDRKSSLNNGKQACQHRKKTATTISATISKQPSVRNTVL